MDILIVQAKGGDNEAFIQLMEQHKQSMYKVAKAILQNNEDVANAMQDTILSCFKSIGKLKSDKFFKTWITKILINKCYDIIEKNKNYINVAQLDEIPYNENFEDSSIANSFSRIDKNYQLVMILYYVNGFTLKEIADLLNMNVNTAKTKLSRGREYFKNAYLQEQKEAYTYEL